MIKKLSERFSKAFATTGAAEPDEDAREKALQMATAVLMIEIARADHDYDESEFDLLLNLITNRFQISPQEAIELANEADEAAEDSVSLHSFTDLLHNSLSHSEKEHIVSLLWQVAYADGRLDKYEDSMVMKISGLLHVSRMRVMRLKHDANPQAYPTTP